MVRRKRRKGGRKPSGIDKSLLNTTIRTEVLDEFKETCNEIKVPMNSILECFMEQFNSGHFKMRIGPGPLRKADVELELKEFKD